MKIAGGIAIGGGLLLAAFISSVAMAAQPPQGSSDDPDRLALPLEGAWVHPDWVHKPNGADFSHFYPPLPQILGLQGFAALACSLGTDGALSNCKVVADRPAGMGFGDATLLMAGDFHMTPETLDGRPITSKVTVPIRWTLAYAPLKPPAHDAAPAASSASPQALALARRIIAARGTTQRLAAQLDQTMHAWIDHAESGGAPAPAADEERTVLALVRQSSAQAVSAYAEVRAGRLAAAMTMAELQATARFLESPAGRGWTAAQQQMDVETSPGANEIWNRARYDARNAFCQRVACPGQDPPLPPIQLGGAAPAR